jgi:hypothetical protein
MEDRSKVGEGEEKILIPSPQVLRNIDARNPDAVTIANPYGGPLPRHLRDHALALRDQNPR